jgi:hypothetical protein
MGLGHLLVEVDAEAGLVRDLHIAVGDVVVVQASDEVLPEHRSRP